jgi:putative ABC transport system permease protein
MTRRRSLEGLERDIRDHIERETQDNVDRGMRPDEARAAAIRSFGNITRIKEDTRAVWTVRWVQQVLQDLSYGLRTLRRNPGFAAAAILTLTLGIGMNTAVFSVLDAVLLRPISYPHSERLVWLATYDDRSAFPMEIALGPDVVDWRDQAASFDHVVAYEQWDATVLAGGAATQSRVASVSEGFWEIAGARPELGRLPARGERNTLVLSHAFFERQFKGDPGAIGKTVVFDGEPAILAAVLAPAFRFELPPAVGPGLESKDVEADRPFEVVAPSRDRLQIFNAIGRLRSGVPMAAARAELEAIRARTALAHPSYRPNKAALRVTPLHEKLVGSARVALYVLSGAVLFVLLIACANIANLLLGRASARQREIAIRASVGASRARVFRQLLVESLLLAFVGGAAGVVFAHFAIAAITRLAPHAVPRLSDATIDARALLFTLIRSSVTAMAFGIAPALALRRVDLHGLLKDGARTFVRSRRASLSGRWLVALELALAVMLLAGAGLMIKSVSRLNAHPPGFDP